MGVPDWVQVKKNTLLTVQLEGHIEIDKEATRQYQHCIHGE